MSSPSRLSRRHLLQAAVAGVAPTSFAPAAFAQAGFPSKPIKFIVAFPPGGATDLVGRLIANKLQEAWGQNVVVENKAGASGMIGSSEVMRAPADGHTALVTITTHIQNSAIFAKVPYDPLKDFEPVSQICLSYLVLVVKPDFPASNLKDFIALVKANPGKYSFGSFGTGSSSHIVGETFARKAGLDMAHVPYKGSALMLTDLLGGQVPLAWADVSTATQHIAAGKLKPLAVTGERRAPLLAQVPTLLELGFPGFEPLGWVGILLPARTPKAIVDKYSDTIVKIVKMPDVRARLYEQTLMPVGDNAASFARTLKRDMGLWQNIVTTAGIKPQ